MLIDYGDRFIDIASELNDTIDNGIIEDILSIVTNMRKTTKQHITIGTTLEEYNGWVDNIRKECKTLIEKLNK